MAKFNSLLFTLDELFFTITILIAGGSYESEGEDYVANNLDN